LKRSLNAKVAKDFAKVRKAEDAFKRSHQPNQIFTPLLSGNDHF